MERNNPRHPKVSVTAELDDVRSSRPLPGFNGRHGFRAVLPYSGDPGPTSLCISLNRGASAFPSDQQLRCFDYDEPAEAFGTKEVVDQGDPIGVQVRNVGAGTRLNVNLLSDAGYFFMPWELELDRYCRAQGRR